MPSNFANQTIWTGDNLDILRGMNSECVDLIYLDPPFNSNKSYAAPIGSSAAGAAFKDTWTLSDHRDNLQLLCNACNSMKGAGTQETFIAKLKKNGIRD